MSQTRWQALFAAATYVETLLDATVENGMVKNPARTLLDPGDLAPQDLIGHEVRHYLAVDPVLSKIFKGRIEYMPARNPLDFRPGPRLQVYLTSNANSERPTAVALEELSVYVGIRADQMSVEPIANGNVSVATVLARIKRVLRATKARALTVWYGPRERGLAMDVGIAAERLLVDAEIVGQNERIAYVHEVQFTYRLHIDKNTGQLINLQAA